jgi:hypothetical protein
MKKKLSPSAYWAFVILNLIWLVIVWWDQPTGTRKWAYLLLHLLNLTLFTRLALRRE